MDSFTWAVVLTLSGVFGVCVGSFLNVVIYRVPNGMSLATPASHCTSCHYTLRWYDNVPVLSYLFLGGKCRKCRTHISFRYTLVELANAALWLLSAWLFWEESIVYACISALACSILICIFFIDLEHMLIFNRFTVSLAVLGVVAIFFDSFTAPLDHIIGAIVGAAVFAGLYYGSIKILKKEGIGWGDVKLAAAAGLLLGWQKLILTMLIASVVACILLVTLNRLRRDDRDREYPFAPFITVGMLIAMLFGSPIITWYVNLLLG